VRVELLLEGWKDRLDGVPAGVANDVGDEQNSGFRFRHWHSLGGVWESAPPALRATSPLHGEDTSPASGEEK
jgi:hypothetical protein